MELKQVTLNNNGMQQDLSISKDGKDFAYKNYNIRIQATGDGTLASVTNIKSPKKINSYNISGKVLNSILCGKYIVVFTHFYSSHPEGFIDYIYRIDLEDNFNIRVLYSGDLNFSYDRPIDSTYYYENDKVQKVYWVDGWTTDGNNNYPRVINIITEGERDGGNFTSYPATTNFDFYPELKYVPTISAVKNFDVPSELPSGMIQYFVSFFNKNKSETLIAAGTSLYSIDFKDKGTKADNTGCAFNVTVNIQNESQVIGGWASSYEYIRLYSVRRTSINGDATVNVVKEFKIEPNVTSYTVLDNGTGQETIDPGQIFFVGGTPLFAKTLCQKDNTLFIGGIKTEGILINNNIKERIAGTIKNRTELDNDDIVLKEAAILTEETKTIPTSDVSFNAYYPYKLQKDNESIVTKTFKVGEIYRFGIQFQNKQGQWSEVLWIGDKKISEKPVYNSDGTFSVSNIRFFTSSSIITEELSELYNLYKDIFIDLKREGFINYRLVMADPEYSNGRSILAQGIICPTLFSPSLRTKNSPHTISSWIMRPRKGVAPYHHLEPLTAARYSESELASYDPNESIDSTDYKYHTFPFEFISSDSSDYTKTSNDINFYIDESILDLYSPDLNANTVIKGTPKLRIIGYAPITSNYSNVETETENIGIDLDYIPNVVSNIIKSHRIADDSNLAINPLYSDYMYLAPKWRLEHQLVSTEAALYNLHMWHFSKSIIGFNIEDDKVLYPNDEEVYLPKEPLVLSNNNFYNHLFSKNIVYINEVIYPLTFGLGIYNGADDAYIQFKKNSSECYAGALEYSHSNDNAGIYSIPEISGESRPENKNIQMSCPITFNSTPHATFYLGETNSKLELLPVFSDETNYSGIFTGKYPVDGIIDSNNASIAGKPAIWKNLKSVGTLTAAENNIKNLFDKKLNAVGSRLGASWIDNFAVYRLGTNTDVYDSTSLPKYKTCCALNTSTSLHNLKDTLLQGYDYEETINGNRCYVVIRYNGSSLTKCYWSIYDTEISNVTSVTLTDDELDVIYPILESGYSQSVYYDVIWQSPNTLPWYPFLKCWKNWDVNIDDYIYYANRITLDSFSAFSEDYIFNQAIINITSPTEPYSFIGELYYDISYNDLYGGTSEEALSKLTWVPVSKPMKLTTGDGHLVTGLVGVVGQQHEETWEDWGGIDCVTVTEGDTYYQRWDCLKTFPKTPEDTNQVVDITSFMVETHINLDERTDPNRANFNMVVNPTNFNLFNDVYNQKNNLFSYTIINDLISEENSHQVAWSLTKNIAGTVDTWTNITNVNAVNLKHPITKLVNFNNKVVGLTEHSVEIINFNAKNLVPTDDNTFIELKNSTKVDGTIDFTIDKGTRNSSVLVTEAGLYFIDDNENSLIRINFNGEIQNLGIGKMDSWFKQHVSPGTYTKDNMNAFHLEYDAKYKDVYICNDEVVIVYNEQLNTFTSFVDYQELVSLFTNKGETYAIASYSTTGNYLYKLYGDNGYGYGFEIFDGINKQKELPYSVQYRINPGPYSDKVFTNVAFKADLNISQDNSSTSNIKPFDYIQAWTEYQDTLKQPLVYDRLSNLKEKFRTWRALIPRNSGTRDRIRNPWMHLELSQDKDSVGQKLEFHNISVTYME